MPALRVFILNTALNTAINETKCSLLNIRRGNRGKVIRRTLSNGPCKLSNAGAFPVVVQTRVYHRHYKKYEREWKYRKTKDIANRSLSSASALVFLRPRGRRNRTQRGTDCERLRKAYVIAEAGQHHRMSL